MNFIINYKSYFELMVKVTHNAVEFWQEFDNEKPNVIKIYKIGDHIAQDFQSLKVIRDYFTENYYHHFAINFSYGCFLKFILNNPKEANFQLSNSVKEKYKGENLNNLTVNHN